MNALASRFGLERALGQWLAALRRLGVRDLTYYSLRLLAPACTLTLDWAFAAFWIASDAVLATVARWLWSGGWGRRVLAFALNAVSGFANVLLALSLWLQGAGFNAQFFFHATAETLLWGYEAIAPVFYGCWAYWLLLSLWPLALRRGDGPPKRTLLLCATVALTLNAPVLSFARHVFSYAAQQMRVVLVPKTPYAAIAAEPLQSPRNLVLVLAEGLEATYGLPDVFGEDATPQLTRLSEQGIRFANMRQVSNTSRTVGAMVAAQCAFPLGPAGDVNAIVGALTSHLEPAATCMGDILQAHGYRTVYLGGASLAFANKEGFLAAHGFDERYGLRRLRTELTDPSQTSIFGVRDDFLFAFALNQLAELEAATPFALVLLTLDTHGPFGFPSASCGANTGEGLLFAIRCADRLLAEFIGEVRRRHPDALVALLSDHLGNFNDLGRSPPTAEQRRLRFNVWGEGVGPPVVDRPGTHFDVTPTLLDLLGLGRWTELGLGASLLRFDSPWFSRPDSETLRVVHALPAVRARPGDVVAFHAEGPIIEIDGVRMLATHRGLRLDDAVFAVAFDANHKAVRHRSFAGLSGEAMLRQVQRWAGGQRLVGASTHRGFNRRLARGEVHANAFFLGRLGTQDLVVGRLDAKTEVRVRL